MNHFNKKNICVMTFPIKKTGTVPLKNMIDILSLIASSLYLITGNDGYEFFKNSKNVQAYGVNHVSGKNLILRILRYIWTQIRISYIFVKNMKQIDICIFFIGGDCLVLPMIIAKLLAKRTILVFAGSCTDILGIAGDGLYKITKILRKVNCKLSDQIILYSSNLEKEWGLGAYHNKIIIAHEHHINFDIFQVNIKYIKRNNIVGFVGSLSEQKGVFHFTEAIPLIVDKMSEYRFMIAGDGKLSTRIAEYIRINNLNEKVITPGWIDHVKLPVCLNELKLLVLPSYTEGLPNIMLEAMACGTPVLATPVGAIPDVIKDGETGFLLEDNSPECIAETALKILNMPDDKLEKVSENARKLVEKEFTFENVVERWGGILERI
jgi:glycosyltransferase involved in cell wall biosynthesis